MSMLQEDRLKAFLERNKNRISTKPESTNISALQNSQLIQSDIIKTSNTESSKPSSTNAIDNILLPEIKHDSKGSSGQDAARKQRKDYPEMQNNNSTYFSTTSSDSLAYHLDNRSNIAVETPQKNLLTGQSQTKDSKVLKQSKTFESNGSVRKNNKSRHGMSISPSKSLQWESTSSSKSKNRIEDYIKSRKESRNKIRERVRSLSNESSHTLRPLRSSLILNNSTIKSRVYDSNSRSSIANETHDYVTSTKSNAFDRLSRSQIFDSFSTRQKKTYASSKKTTLKSNATTKSKEYCFEEAEDEANPVKNKSNSKAPSRSKSRSSNISPVRSLIDKTKKETSSENVKSKSNKEKSRDKSFGKQGPKFFPESSKKLSVLDSSLDNGHKFKKEIKTLIGVIKKEREQITSELEHMSHELKKYKTAYKSLKKEVTSGKKVIKDAREGNQSSSHVDFNISRTHVEDRSIVKDQGENISYPFTINELTQYIQNSVPVQNEENIEDLLANIDSVHTDVETILKRSEFESKSPQRRLQDSKTFELRRTPVNCFIIKDMNLPPSLFFQDTYPEEPIECKPNLIDLLAAQREVIYFLVKKLEIEEQQRLKTEEQASKMISSMEKTIKSLEGKNSGIKRTEPYSQLDLNKSGISHISYKSDNANQTIE